MLGKTPLTYQIVDLLDKSERYHEAMPFLDTFRNRSDNKHGNSFLHEAIVWSRKDAAAYLISLAAVADSTSLSLVDTFSSSRSTPLILASKTGDNSTALALIGLFKTRVTDLDQQDYIGNTALHYACLMRNDELIQALLLQGADPNIRNDRGCSPLEYYKISPAFEDLNYHYGTRPGSPYLMNHVCDWDSTYQGTHHPSFSNYRWFLLHIILNLGLDLEVADLDKTEGHLFMFSNSDHRHYLKDYSGVSSKEIIRDHISFRVPVIDLRIYHGLVRTFLAYRERSFSEERLKQLSTKMLVPGKYAESEHFNQFYF